MSARRLAGALLLVVVAVRIYLLVVTAGQPVWWDEAEYLIKAKSIAFGTPDTGFFSGRPMLLSLVLAGIYAVGGTEQAIRIVMALISVAAVVLTFAVGRRLFDELTGFVAALLFSFYYSELFYSARVMTEIPHVALCLLGAWLYLSGHLLPSVPVLVLAALARFPAALFLVVLAVHAVACGRAAPPTRAVLGSAALGVAVALPYFVWAAVVYGDPFHAWKASSYLMPALTAGDRLAGVGHYATGLARSLRWAMAPFAVIGLGRAARWIRRPQNLLVWVWILLPLLYFGLFVRPTEDRFVILVLPAIFFATGEAIVWVATFAGRFRLPVVFAVAAVGAVVLFADADREIRAKRDTFAALRDAGGWIRERSPRGAEVMSQSLAQLTYYSERAAVAVPSSLESFKQTIAAAPEIRYVVFSNFEHPPTWMRGATGDAVGLRVVEVFPREKPNVVVLEPMR